MIRLQFDNGYVLVLEGGQIKTEQGDVVYEQYYQPAPGQPSWAEIEAEIAKLNPDALAKEGFNLEDMTAPAAPAEAVEYPPEPMEPPAPAEPMPEEKESEEQESEEEGKEEEEEV